MATALKDPRIQLSDQRLFREQCYVDGAWIDADDGRAIKVTDPATGETIGTVPSVGVAETRRAIEAAERALPAWRAKTAKERAAILRRWFELVMANADDLAYLMTREQGKPLAEAKGEIGYGASFLEWFAEEAKRVYGDVIPQTVASRRILVLKQPVGVCAAITPWNFPIAMITRKAGPAMAAGCTMVVKPASATPYSALAMAELAERAGVPKGVFNVITGSAGPDRHRALHQQDRAQGLVHRLDRGRQDPAQAVRRHGQAHLDGAGRPRAVHRLRRRRPRQGGRGCDRLQVQERRPDLRLHQPDLRPGRRLRRVRREVRGRRRPSSRSAPAPPRTCIIGPLIDDKAVEKVEEHVGDATRQGCHGRARRQAPPAGRPVLRAHRARQLQRRA